MEKLRILIITQGELSNELGAVKVHYELKAEYESQGHTVDTYDYWGIYPGGRNFFIRNFGRPAPYKIWKFLKENSYKYDVIDANFGDVTYPKESYNFKGVVMARSHGIIPLYKEAEQISGYKNALSHKKNISIKTRIGNIYRYFQKRDDPNVFYDSIKYADIIHCLNTDEYRYFLNQGIPKDKLLLVPNGLPDNLIDKYNNQSATSKTNSLIFIGSWTPRKGIKDLEDILNIIQNHVVIQSFFLLGGYCKAEEVNQDFTRANQNLLKIVPHFKPDDLSSYMSNSKVGIFPSYVEGFGFAVLEKLAFGVPVVAYKVPGPKDILKDLDESLLVEPGNKEEFAKKVIEILELNEEEYYKLAERCKKESKKYFLSKIAHQFLNAFNHKLANQKASVV